MKEARLNLKKILKQVPADYYNRGVKTNIFQKYWHQKKWQILRKFLNGVSAKSLLDIGCADGMTTGEIQRAFPFLKITGLDYHKEAIDFAKKTNPKIKFVVGDAHRLPFKDRSFDVVTTIETLEHLVNPRIALWEIRRVLKLTGYLIVVQDTDSLLFRLVWWLWSKWRGSVWNGSHISCLKPESLLDLLKSSGFSVKNYRYSNFKMEIFVKSRKKEI